MDREPGRGPIGFAELCSAPSAAVLQFIVERIELLERRWLERGEATPAAFLLAGLRARAAAAGASDPVALALDEAELRAGRGLLEEAGTSAAELARAVAASLTYDRERAASASSPSLAPAADSLRVTELHRVPRAVLARWLADPLDAALEGLVQSGGQAARELMELLEARLRDRFREVLCSGHLGGPPPSSRLGDEPPPSALRIVLEVVAREDALPARLLPAELLELPAIRGDGARGYALTARLRTADPLSVSDEHEWSFYMAAEAGEHAFALSTEALRVEPRPDGRFTLEGRFSMALERSSQLFAIELDPARFSFALGVRRRER